MSDGNERCLLLTAREYRSWFLISWEIYSDGSYIIKVIIEPLSFFKDGKRLHKKQSGVLEEERFNKLLKLLSVRNWEKPERVNLAAEGSFWEIKHYAPNGLILESSGELSFVGGMNRPIDRIVMNLPEPNEELFRL